jgi:hypothetical protein
VDEPTVESPVDVKPNSLMDSAVPDDNAVEIAEEEVMREVDKLLIKRVLQLGVELETQARLLIMHTLPKGSRSEILLRADLVRQASFGAAPLLTSNDFIFCSGFSVVKCKICIWKTLTQSYDLKDYLTSASQRVNILILMAESGDIGNYLLPC